MTKVELPANVVNTITLDGDGKRRRIEDSDGVRDIIWDAENILLETDNAGATQRAYTLEPAGYGNLVSQRRAGASKEHHFDALGSTRQLTDSGQAVTDRRDFKAFGAVNASSGATANRFWFIGRHGYWDDPIGYLLLRARWYDADAGVFLTRDPEREGWNWYLYAAANPARLTDPRGEAVFLRLPRPRWPPWPFPRLCGLCGPDISSSLSHVIHEIEQTFRRRWTPKMQRESCEYVASPVRGLIGAWDIDAFSRKPEPCVNYPECAKGFLCNETIEVGGQCFSAVGVNYVEIGLIWRLCEFEWWTLQLRIGAWRGWRPHNKLIFMEAMDWARRGYGLPPEFYASRPWCEPCGVSYPYGFSWTWKPDH